MDDNIFMIYQLKRNDRTRGIRFEPLEQVKAAGGAVEWGNYNHVYTGPLESKSGQDIVDLELIFNKFNDNQPADFVGGSMSVSDVVVIQRDGMTAVYYVDLIDYERAQEFLAAPYRYYSTQRPVDIGTFPKTECGPVKIANYEGREACENATFRAWGYVAYDAPLTEKQAADYELRPASDNPDRDRVSPYQLDAQVQAVGRYEDSKHMNLYKRLTWLHKDFGVYVRHNDTPPARLSERFSEIMGIKARAAENLMARRKPIAEQLAEGAERAARDNADRPTPPPGDNRENR